MPRKKTMNLPEMVVEYITWKMLAASESTINCYQWKLDSYASHCFKENLNPLKPDAVHSFMLLSKKRGVKGITLNHTLAILKSFFQFWVDRELMNRNPTALIPRFPEEAADIVGFKQQDAKDLLSASRSHRNSHYWTPMILLGWHYGMRLGDTAQFERGFVDWKAKQIRFIPRKRKKKEIVLPLVPDVEAALKKVPDEGGSFFPSAKRRYASRGTLSTEFKDIVRAAGLNDKFTYHCLRHGAATRMLESGVRVTTITAIIGWDSPRMLQRYIDRDEVDIAKAFDGSSIEV
jgi:site-specific recombinase XerD